MSYTFEEPVPQSQLADFGSRLGAILIDSVIMSVVLLMFIGLFVGVIVVATDQGAQDPSPGMIAGGLVLYFFGPSVLVITYQALWESSSKQATPGKLLVGLRVVTTGGEKLSFMNAVGRNAGRILSSIMMIGYFMALFTDRKQALHDMMADTLVIYKPADGVTYGSKEENIYRKNLGH
ncbi:MAG: RDD family protein [Bacteroidota bacterium]